MLIDSPLWLDYPISKTCPHRRPHHIYIHHRLDCRVHAIRYHDVRHRRLPMPKRRRQRKPESRTVSICRGGNQLRDAHGESDRGWAGLYGLCYCPGGCFFGRGCAVEICCRLAGAGSKQGAFVGERAIISRLTGVAAEGGRDHRPHMHGEDRAQDRHYGRVSTISVGVPTFGTWIFSLIMRMCHKDTEVNRTFCLPCHLLCVRDIDRPSYAICVVSHRSCAAWRIFRFSRDFHYGVCQPPESPK